MGVKPHKPEMAKETRATEPDTPAILMASPWDQTIGGVVYVFRHLTASMARSGFEPVFFFPDYQYVRVTEKNNAWGARSQYFKLPDLDIPGKPLRSILAGILLLPQTLIALAGLMRRKRIALINCHFLMGHYLYLALAARILGIPFVISVHGADVPPISDGRSSYRLVLKLILRLSTRIVACSESLAADVAQAYPPVRDRIESVPNGMDLAEFREDPPLETGLSPYILTVALQVEKKGIDVLLRAFRNLAKDYPRHRLVLAGYGPLLENHKELAESLGIADRVVFLGGVERDRIQSLFAGCDLFVLPSRQEPFGIVLLEASFYRRAIVATRVGGIPEIIRDGKTGLLATAEDPEDLARKMRTALDDPEMRARLGEAAHDRLHETFSWKACSTRYAELFNSLIDRKS